jgi:hypothetical protein
MSERNYAAERRLAKNWADVAMDKIDGLSRAHWLAMWGVVYDAYLAGLRGKQP